MSLTAANIQAALKAAGAGSGLIMPADQIAAAFNAAILGYGEGQFNTPNTVAALVSECMMESAYFRTTEEYAKNGRYAPYIGRSFIQVTWRDNYAKFGAWCLSNGLVPSADYFVASPKRLADLKWAALGGVWYFTQVMFSGKPLTAYADDIEFVGRAVNGGTNGMAARIAAYKAVQTLGPTTIPASYQEDPVSVAFRGGRTCSCVATSLPLVEKDMIRRGLIKQSIDIFQLGYRTDVGPSAGTHAGGGCTDVAQYSDAQIQCWREWGWTMQHRTPAQGFSHHAHGWPLGCTHLSAAAKAQATQWGNKQNGLTSKGTVTGKYPIDDWKTAMKKQLAAQAERDKKKELELPTTAEVAKALSTDKNFLAAVAKAVVNSDGAVKNTFTGNPANPDVAVATALEYLGSRTKKAEDANATIIDKVNSVGTRLDAIAQAVAALTARFPGA